jgi:hypothetical protein
MFAVIYRWKIRASSETLFREAWHAMTTSIQGAHRTGGSRLHRAENGEWVAYAVWPSRAAWEAAQHLPSVNPGAGARMTQCIEQRFEPLTMEVLDDLLCDFGTAQ